VIQTRDDGVANINAPGAAPILDSRWAEAGGIAAGGALLGWVLLHGDNPVSPSGP
jgi:hypothetical protein